MPVKTKEQLRKAFEEVKARDKRANKYNSTDPTYKNRYYQEMEDNRNLKNSGNALTKKVQSKVPALDRAGYIAENGIDRSDLGLYMNNKDEFNRRVGATVARNLAKSAKNKKK